MLNLRGHLLDFLQKPRSKQVIILSFIECLLYTCHYSKLFICIYLIFIRKWWNRYYQYHTHFPHEKTEAKKDFFKNLSEVTCLCGETRISSSPPVLCLLVGLFLLWIPLTVCWSLLTPFQNLFQCVNKIHKITKTFILTYSDQLIRKTNLWYGNICASFKKCVFIDF